MWKIFSSFEMTLIVVNITGVGVSDVREKFLGKGFSSNYMMTIGVEFALKEVTISDLSSFLINTLKISLCLLELFNN